MTARKLLEELKERGVKRVVLEFSGTDDSGGYDHYLEPNGVEERLPENLRKALEEWLEEELERLFDEHLLSFNDSGCEGSLVVDLESGQVEFEAWGHRQVYEEEERECEAPFEVSMQIPPATARLLREKGTPEVLQGAARYAQKEGWTVLDLPFPDDWFEELYLGELLDELKRKAAWEAAETYAEEDGDLPPPSRAELLEARFSFALDLGKGILEAKGEAKVRAAYEVDWRWETDNLLASEEAPLPAWLAEGALRDLEEV